MPRTARPHSISNYYHVINRGVGQQILFEDETDYRYFLKLLRERAKEENVQVLAYCLMDNHFHFLLYAESGTGRLMQRICGSYARYYNAKYERTGHLFQDRYKSIPLETARALLTVVRYIHNNPSAAGFCSKENYPWSSWHEYTGTTTFVSTGPVLLLTEGVEGFLRFSDIDETDECLDFDNGKSLSDTQAKEIIRKVLNLESGVLIQKMSREQRNASIKLLKKQGCSTRQLERLTGISRGIIMRA